MLQNCPVPTVTQKGYPAMKGSQSKIYKSYTAEKDPEPSKIRWHLRLHLSIHEERKDLFTFQKIAYYHTTDCAHRANNCG